MAKIKQLNSDLYVGVDDPLLRVEREYGKTPNGNFLDGRWVLRYEGIWGDFDTYRYDLFERNGLETEG